MHRDTNIHGGPARFVLTSHPRYDGREKAKLKRHIEIVNRKLKEPSPRQRLEGRDRRGKDQEERGAVRGRGGGRGLSPRRAVRGKKT